VILDGSLHGMALEDFSEGHCIKRHVFYCTNIGKGRDIPGHRHFMLDHRCNFVGI